MRYAIVVSGWLWLLLSSGEVCGQVDALEKDYDTLSLTDFEERWVAGSGLGVHERAISERPG